MTSAVDLTALNDADSNSNLLKRRRSSTLNCHEMDIDSTPSKRVRAPSPPSSHFLFDPQSQTQTIVNSLNDILQTHRNLIEEYVQLQMHDRTNLSIDEQRFIQAEEDLIEKTEKNLNDIHQNPSNSSFSPLISSSRHGKRQRIQSICSNTSPSVDRVKHETHILKRIEELKADGKWTPLRLAKCLEPNKRKAHWDYLLDEMRWLAEDFHLERQWKQAMAKKISQAVLKYFREKNQLETKLLEQLRQRARYLAKEVMLFWTNMSKIAEWKEAKRREEFHRDELDFQCHWIDEEHENNDPTLFSAEQEIEEEDRTTDEEDEDEDEVYSPSELKELEEDQQLSIETVLKRNYGLELRNESISSADQLIRFAQSLRPKSVTFDSTPVEIPLSFLFKSSLREYQHIALQWLIHCSNNHLNCIFADPISLGKNLVIIALLTYFATEKSQWGPTLLIVPSRFLPQWEFDLKRFAPGLKFTVNYGSKLDRTSFHLCLTSEDILRRNLRLFSGRKWFYVIADRVELLKNLVDLSSEHRLLLFDQFPLDKSVDEIDGFVQYLLPQFYSKWFQSSSIDELRQILEPLILSRTTQLAQRSEQRLFCEFSARQKKFSEKILRGEFDRSTTKILMLLRKVWNHPNLIERRMIRSAWMIKDDPVHSSIPIDLFALDLKNPSIGFDSLFHSKFFYFHKKFILQPNDDRIDLQDEDDSSSRILFTKEILERYRNTPLWNVDEKKGSRMNNHLKIKPNKSLRFHYDDLHSTEFSESSSDDRVDLRHFDYSPWFGTDTLEQIRLAIKPCRASNRTSFTGYALCQTEVIDHPLRSLIKTWSDRFEDFREIHRSSRFFIRTKRVLVYRRTSIEEIQRTQELLSTIDTTALSSLDHIEENMFIEYPDRRSLHDDCGKFQSLDRLLMKIRADRHRSVVFSSMMDMLDLLEEFCRFHHYSYLRLDPFVDPVQRTMIIERFNTDRKIFLLLCSTRLNEFRVKITGVNAIVFYDFEWNRSIDEHLNELCQQIEPIDEMKIFRLFNRNTIEEKLFDRIHRESSLNFVDDLLDLKWRSIKENNASICITEDPIDCRAAEEFHQSSTSNEVEMDLETKPSNDDDPIAEQLRPIERYALRCVENHLDRSIDHRFTSIGYWDAEQFSQEWQESCLKKVQEEDERFFDQEDDGIVYTYARDYDNKIWVTEDGQTFEIWSGILPKRPIDDDGEYYVDDVLDIGYESEAMFIEPEDYVRYPLPKALADATNTSKLETNVLVPRSLFDRSNLLLNPQSSSLMANFFNKNKTTVPSPKVLPNALAPTPSTPPANLKGRQLFVNNGTTTTPLPTVSSPNVIVPASTGVVRPIKLEENLSKEHLQSLLEIDNSDWLISEDHKVLDAIQNIQQLPYPLNSLSNPANAAKPPMMLSNPSSSLLPSNSNLPSSPTASASSSSTVNNTSNALTPNWDFISDIVNRYSRVLRTPKQCKHRFEQVIGPREEGRVVYDPVKKKKHVIKGTVKLSDDNLQTCRTNQLFSHENCQKLNQIFHQKFETIVQCESQVSPMVYLNKFKQMQTAQAHHHQMRGLRQGSLLQENKIQFDPPLTPGDVLYQRSEREKELKQQQVEASANNSTSAQQQTVSAANNAEINKPTPSSNNPTPARTRPTPLNTQSVASITPAASAPMSIISGPPSSNPPPTIQRSLSSNIIVAGNPSTLAPSRTPSNVLPSRSNITPSPTPTVAASTPTTTNPSSISTATFVPGQRTVQVLPANHLQTTETNLIQQKQTNTVQIPTNEYPQIRPALSHPQPTPSSISNPPTTPTNLQVRAQNYVRNQTASNNLTPTVEVRPSLPSSPKAQQVNSPARSFSAATRPTQAELIHPTPTKAATLPMAQSPMPVATVRSLQHSATSLNPTISSTATTTTTTSITLPSANVTLPTKLTSSTATISNPNPNNQGQLRATTTATGTTFLSNSLPTSSTQNPTVSQQLRQLVTNNPATTFSNPSNPNTTRITETTARPTSNIQQIIASRAPLTGSVRNVRIVTLTPSNAANPPATISSDATSTNNPAQTKITYNRSNSSTGTEISPELAAQLQRLKAFPAAAFTASTNDSNDSNPPQRTVYFPARTITSAGAASTGATAKFKAGTSLDPTTVALTGKTSQANIVFQLPAASTSNVTNPTVSSTSNASGEEQSAHPLPAVTRQTLQHFSIISSTVNPRPQSPTTTTTPISIRNFLQQYQQIRGVTAATSNPSATSTQDSTGSSTSGTPSAPSSSS